MLGGEGYANGPGNEKARGPGSLIEEEVGDVHGIFPDRRRPADGRRDGSILRAALGAPASRAGATGPDAGAGCRGEPAGAVRELLAAAYPHGDCTIRTYPSAHMERRLARIPDHAIGDPDRIAITAVANPLFGDNENAPD